MGVAETLGRHRDVPVARVDVTSYTIPTSQPEADGTFEWDATTLVVVEVEAGGVRGLGYTYADVSTATLIHTTLADVVVGHDALATSAAWMAMRRAVRNIGAPGIAAMAIAGIDNALWDLKARLLQVPVFRLIGAVRDRIAGYGSGGFTNQSAETFDAQLRDWADAGFRFVKMKIGRDEAADIERVRAARAAIGNGVELFVDANGAYAVHEALRQAQRLADHGVTYFEEPVSSDDVDGLRDVRRGAPPGMAIAAGEYGYTPDHFRNLLTRGAVDILQADATRCMGVTGFLEAGALAAAFHCPLSAHTAPSLHAHLGCALPAACHIEYFHDHVRVERMLFDGVPLVRDGDLIPDPQRPGFGLEFKRADARRYAVGLH